MRSPLRGLEGRKGPRRPKAAGWRWGAVGCYWGKWGAEGTLTTPAAGRRGALRGAQVRVLGVGVHHTRVKR